MVKKGFVLWFTGLSGSGKTTSSKKVAEILSSAGNRIENLDGDEVREALTKDLGFSKEDRDVNVKRVGFVAKLLSQNNVGVISAFISPYAKAREEIRNITTNFIEVHVSAPLEVCERRDVKGLYKRARAGQIKNFTGISDPYESPVNPEIVLNTHEETPEESAQKVVEYLKERDFI